MKIISQRRKTAGSALSYVLLAMAVIGLIISWASLKSRGGRIEALEALDVQSNEKISDLNQQLSITEQKNTALTTRTEQIPILKKQLSFSNAEIQRGKLTESARQNLIEIKADLEQKNEALTTENSAIAGLKKNLSLANAANQRAEHVAAARQNLSERIVLADSENGELKQLAATIPGIKSKLSHANAANARLTHISSARDSLMDALDQKKQENTELQTQVDTIPGLKFNLSNANATNARLTHISSARDNLMVALDQKKQENVELQALVDTIPGIKEELTAAKGEVNRLTVIENATKTFIDSVGGSLNNVTEPSVEPTSRAEPVLTNEEELTRAELDRSLAVAEAQRAKVHLNRLPELAALLNEVTLENQQLKDQVSVIPALKKDLSFARAEIQRFDQVKFARENLMERLKSNDALAVEQAAALASVSSVMSEVKAQHAEEMDALELKRSMAVAEAQRAKVHLNRLPELTASLNEVKREGQQLEDQVSVIPVLKKDLSYARAEIQRLDHVKLARENLMERIKSNDALAAEQATALASASSTITELQAQHVEEKDALELKRSMAAADAQRAHAKLKSVPSLLGQINETNTALVLSEEKVAKISKSAEAELAILKKNHSLAAAEAQRAKVELNRIPKLMASVNSLTVENERLQEEVAAIPTLKKELGQAQAEIQRLSVINQARQNLTDQPDVQANSGPNTVQTLSAAATAVTVATVSPTPVVDDRAMLQQKLDQLKPQIRKNLSFVSGSAWVNFKARKTLNRVAKILIENPDMKVEIGGHTDSFGRATTNKELSQTRADRVLEYLASRNVAREQLVAVGFGSGKPLTTNNTKQGRTENRRVEFKVVN